MAVVEMERTDEQTERVQLVLAAQLGDREAFGLLAQMYERHVYNVGLRRLNNHAEAQELCQDVLVQAMQKLDQLRAPECFGGWLRSMANRMAINRAIRRRPIATAEPETLTEACHEQASPLALLLAGERQSQVRAGLKRLGTLDRKTLVAFYVRGLSLIEMADEFVAPIGTIKRRLHVARKRLARELKEVEA